MVGSTTSLADLVALDHLPAVLQDYVLYPFITLLMCLLSVFIVLGNLLVVSAIWHENQLHSVTNYLIASLAAADCLVGALVMPFSIISEMIIGSWTFGPTWCDLWHSFDVLASTASIMNLCAISLDRYLAITNPICYPTKMTPKRVALLIVSLWTCSSLISFPAILWWHAVGEGPLQQVESPANSSEHLMRAIFPEAASVASRLTNDGGAQDVISRLGVDDAEQRYDSQQTLSQRPMPMPTDLSLGVAGPGVDQDESVQFKCVFTDDTYYLLFSSFVSFYGPLCVMLYAYICIYKAAVQQTRFLKYGSKQVMISGGNGAGGADGRGKKSKRRRQTSEYSGKSPGNRLDGSEANSCDNYERQHLVLRVHRGGGAAAAAATTANNNNNNNNNTSFTTKVDSLADRQVAVATAKVATSPPSMSAPRHMRSVLKHARHKTPQRASLTDDDGDDEEDDESELDQRRHDQLASSLDQTSTLSGSFNEAAIAGGGIVRATPPDSSWSSMEVNQSKRLLTRTSLTNNNNDINNIRSNNSSRVSLALSKRDKKRVESQRFTSSPEASMQVLNNSAQQIQATTATATANPSSSGDNSIEPNCLVNAAVVQARQPSPSSPIPALSQKSCDMQLEKIRNKRVSTSLEMSSSRRDCQDGDGPAQERVGSAGFRFVSALRRSDSRPPPLPASLVPLIMMNSDTSTDSSIITVVTRPVDEQAAAQTSVEGSSTQELEMVNGGEAADKQDESRGLAYVAPAYELREKLRNGGSDTGSTRSSTGSNTTAETRSESVQIRRPNQVTINLSFGDSTETKTTTTTSAMATNTNSTSSGGGQTTCAASGKGQILHYDSDRLIQSIVDLSNIHYIDCAANNQLSLASASASEAKSPDVSSPGADDPTGGGTAKTVHRSLGARSSSQGGAGKNQTQAQVAVEMRDQSISHHHQRQQQNHTASNEPPPVSPPALGGRAKMRHSSSARSQQTTSATAMLVEAPEHATAVVVAGVPARQQKSMGRKLTKLAKERKAAKTLGIVVGVFILCWLPFFVVNILVALCGIKCIYKPEILHQVVTWLGWLNSAMNPVIYACWSRDFRRAFRRVLCTWVEFLCYDGTRLARKLKLKKSSGYANSHDAYSSCGRPASSTQRSGASLEINVGGYGGGGGCGGGGGGSGNVGIITNGSVIRTSSNNNSHRGLLSEP